MFEIITFMFLFCYRHLESLLMLCPKSLSSVNCLDLKGMLKIQKDQARELAHRTNPISCEAQRLHDEAGNWKSIHFELCPSQAGYKGESRTRNLD